MFKIFKRKEETHSTHGAINRYINNKKKFDSYDYDRVINLYNEILFYIGETEKYFYYDYLEYLDTKNRYSNCKYECFTNYETSIDWDKGYFVGNKYGNIYKNSFTDIIVYEYFTDCYCKEFDVWNTKLGFLNDNERKRFDDLIDNNYYCHLYVDNGAITYKRLSIRELINRDLIKHEKTL